MFNKTLVGIAALCALSLGAGAARAGDVKVCVQVVERLDDGTGTADAPKAGDAADKDAAPDAAPGGEVDMPPAPAPAGDQTAASPETAAPAPLLALPGPQSRPRAQAEPLFPAKPTRGPIPLWTNDTKLPIGQTSVVYLKRLFEHFVTHQPGYIAVDEKCDQRIIVELYPLREGWTAFARYSGTGREERVDQLFPSELSQYAERAVLALIKDVPISDTINRENVLRSDSQKSAQRVKGSNHFVLVLVTQLRGGQFDRATDSAANPGGVESKIYLFSPLKTGLGYRGRFESWGLETMAHVGIGTEKTSVNKNAQGGNVDLGGDAGLAVHFLHYFDPRGLTSFYLGAGSIFELLWFRVIKAEARRDEDTRSTLVTGGLDVDGVFGWEFMRAAAVQFYLQGEINLPAYAAKTEDTYGSVDTWFPGISLKLGVVF
jgi:hypothetical protein